MEVADALAALQLSPGASWSAIRTSYRRLLRANHPDLTTEPGAAERTAQLTAAYAVLQKATGNGRRPLPVPPAERRTPHHPRRGRTAASQGPASAGQPTDRGPGTTGTVVGRRSPEDVFRRLQAAAPVVGNLSGLDPETLTLQILVEAPGAAPAQLLAEVSRKGPDTAIMFTLESLTAAPGPPIEPIVKRLLAAL